MPWAEVSTMSLRHEFVVLSVKPGANMAELCRRFRISRKTGYKWRQRFVRGGAASWLRCAG
jgi:transposase-like protein